jgi:hypothetical protein
MPQDSQEHPPAIQKIRILSVDPVLEVIRRARGVIVQIKRRMAGIDLSRDRDSDAMDRDATAGRR